MDNEALRELISHLKTQTYDTIMKGYAGSAGPFDVACIEAIRDSIDFTSLTKRETDFLVLNYGRTNDRTATQMGSPPFFPASKPWPVRDGKPMRFFIQVNFSNSKDILPELPGDILVIFVTHETYAYIPEEIHVEWFDLRESNLMPADRTHVCDWEHWTFGGCWGVPYRTFDVLETKPVILQAGRAYPIVDEVLGAYTCLFYHAARWSGMKIGGYPSFHYPDQELADLNREQRLIFSYGAIYPSPTYPYPWLNRPTPHEREELCVDSPYCMNVMDGFEMFVFLDGANRVTITSRI